MRAAALCLLLAIAFREGASARNITYRYRTELSPFYLRDGLDTRC